MTNLTIDALERWVLFGAQWRIVDLSGESAVVDLCTCTGGSSSAWNRTILR